MVKIKGDSPFDKYVVQNIEACMTENIAFHNITFDCKTIKDASGNVFVRIPPMPERKMGKWVYAEDEYGIDGYHCNQCGFFVPWDYTHKFINYIEDYHYCPNCGCRMKEGAEHD